MEQNKKKPIVAVVDVPMWENQHCLMRLQGNGSP